MVSKHISDKGPVSGTYKELLKLFCKKQSNWMKAKDKKRHFTEEETQMTKQHIKIY